MIKEWVGGYMFLTPRGVGFLAHEPKECTVCHRMSCFFENKDGITRCTGCEGEKRESARMAL